jgi:hypothetical protein
MAAASVFFHAVLGCCAHHTHAGQHTHGEQHCLSEQHGHAAQDGHPHAAGDLNDATELNTTELKAADKAPPCAGHCSHDQSLSEAASHEAAAYKVATHKVACTQFDPSSGCPDHGPSHCSQHPCYFWAPESSNPLTDDHFAGVYLSLLDMAPGHASVIGPALMDGPRENFPPFSPETLRQHLALSVLLI